MKKLKLAILIITSHTYPFVNAKFERMKFLVQASDAIIFTNQVDLIQKLIPDVQVIDLQPPRKFRISIVESFIYWKYIAKEINKAKVDGVFMTTSVTSPVALWLNRPVFQYVHQYGERSSENKKIGIKKHIKNILNKLNNYLFVKGLQKSKLNFVVSNPIIDLLNGKGVYNLTLIPHGKDIKKYQQPDIFEEHKQIQELKKKNYYLVGYIGWVTMNRGFELMMNSLKEAVKKDQKIVFVIAGADQFFTKKINDFATDNELKQNIINFGVVDATIIPGIIYYLDVCLSFLDADIPAYKISPPQKVIEYFAAGKPVICNKISTHEWLVDHGSNGYILNPDPAEVCEAIFRLKNDKTLYEAMADSAFHTAKKYDIDLIYGNMVQLIEKCLNDV